MNLIRFRRFEKCLGSVNVEISLSDLHSVSANDAVEANTVLASFFYKGKAIHALVDTGASFSCINSKLVLKLDLPVTNGTANLTLYVPKKCQCDCILGLPFILKHPMWWKNKLIFERYNHVLRDELGSKKGAFTKVTHRIHPIPGKNASYKPPYRISLQNREQMKTIIKELIETQKIFPTSSPHSSPVILAAKKDGSKRLVVDCGGLNEITIKSWFPLPRIEDLLDLIYRAKIFSKLDLISGSHQIPVQMEDRHKTAMVTRS